MSATGELTGAPFGFANTFLHMFGELKPDARHRHPRQGRRRPSATKSPTPTRPRASACRTRSARSSRRQLDRTRELIETFGIPIVRAGGLRGGRPDGHALPPGCRRRASTPTSSRWTATSPSSSATTSTSGCTGPYQRDSVIFKTPQDVMERYGVLPEQMADLKALKGDTSDNIPGVPGVGDKTAIKLVDQFGSVEAMLDRVDEVAAGEAPGRRPRQRRPDPPVSKRLATIDCDAPVTLDLEAADFYAHYDRERVSEFFREMEFRTLIPRLPEGTARPPRRSDGDGSSRCDRATTRRSSTSTTLDELVDRIAKQKSFALDIETAPTARPMRCDDRRLRGRARRRRGVLHPGRARAAARARTASSRSPDVLAEAGAGARGPGSASSPATT